MPQGRHNGQRCPAHDAELQSTSRLVWELWRTGGKTSPARNRMVERPHLYPTEQSLARRLGIENDPACRASYMSQKCSSHLLESHGSLCCRIPHSRPYPHVPCPSLGAQLTTFKTPLLLVSALLSFCERSRVMPCRSTGGGHSYANPGTNVVQLGPQGNGKPCPVLDT